VIEVQNEIWRFPVDAVGIERKMMSSIDSLKFRTSNNIDLEGMEIDHLKRSKRHVYHSCEAYGFIFTDLATVNSVKSSPLSKSSDC
jgi:hypothetical protein